MSTKHIKLEGVTFDAAMDPAIPSPNIQPDDSSIIFDTTGQDPEPRGLIIGEHDDDLIGQSFSTGDNPGVLTDVQVDLSDIAGFFNTGNISVELWSDGGAGFGADQLIDTIGTISELQLTMSDQLFNVPVSSSDTLTADTRYWIVLDSDQPSLAEWDVVDDLSGTEAGSEYYEYEGSVSSDNASDQAFGMQVTVDSTCYAAGTHILTDRGEVRVEQLRAGDKVMATRRGEFAEVQWIGHRTIDLRRHPRPQNIDPVRIAAGAFGDNLPHRDLVLSPDHSVFVDSALLPIRYLINGATIRQETRDRITYYHIELDAHDVLLAEGLPAETFLDVGNRGAFRSAKGPVALHPDFAVGATLDPEEAQRIWQAHACAPSLTDQAARAALHKTLLDRARELGHATTEDPDLRLLAAGEIIRPEMTGNDARLHLPPETERVYLMSRSVTPSHLGLPSQDGRRLGIGITSITLDETPIDLTDPRLATGWHAPEPTLRWTDGVAALETNGARTLTLTLHAGLAYWATARSIPRQQAA